MADFDPFKTLSVVPHFTEGDGPAAQREREGSPPRNEFFQEARPRHVDPRLSSLEPETGVLFHFLPALQTGESWCSASEVVAEIQEQIDRQAAGFFTLAEVAHILTDGNTGCEVRDLIKRMTDARLARTPETPRGRRLPRESGSKAPVRDDASAFAFLWVVSPQDVDEWLAGSEMSVPYRFPKASEAEPVQLQGAAALHTAASTKSSTWSLTKPQRCDGLAMPVYRVLKAAHDACLPRPTAREVLEAFRTDMPPGILRFQADGCDYLDPEGEEQGTDLKKLRRRIHAMTTAKAPR